jgi:RNA-directed DNA polymerase
MGYTHLSGDTPGTTREVEYSTARLPVQFLYIPPRETSTVEGSATIASGRPMIRNLSHGLALAFLAGPWSREGMIERGVQALGMKPSWLAGLVRRVIKRFPELPVDGEVAMIAMLCRDPTLREAVIRGWPGSHIRQWLIPEPAMVPVKGPPSRFPVTPVASVGALAERLSVEPETLAWFADLQRINTTTRIQVLSHYRCRWVIKSRGGYRLVEAPKPRLREIQRWILRHILVEVPAAPVAHGFIHGRSVHSFVQPHVGHAVVVRLDLEDFFAAIGRARIVAIFRRLGYPSQVAAMLAGLCTVATPEHVLAAHSREGIDPGRRFLANQRLRGAHLPQGAPTSPALANLACFRLDIRMSALAHKFGATMTRYADDIAFSGERGFDHALSFFLPQIGAIALEEGFHINYRKTRVMRRSERQQLCGMVVNEKPNLPRREIDNLKALLWNSIRFGPESQNRDRHTDFRRHLEGRIAWVKSIHPAHGRRLRDLFERICWVQG